MRRIQLFAIAGLFAWSTTSASSQGTNVIAQQAYLKAFDTAPNDRFATAVAISGDTVAVGAPFENSNATGVNDYGNVTNDLAPGSGAVYVFVRNGTTWSQPAYLKASNTQRDANFGQSVAISGDTIVVGAPYEGSVARGSGAAYVFVRTGPSTWTQQAHLKASNVDNNDAFGSSVAVSGDTIVVGAPGETSNATGVNGDQTNNSTFFAGAAYIFARTGGTWTQQAYVKASNTEAWDYFGASVAVSGNTVVIGASAESGNGVDGNQSDNSAPSAGAAYVFAHDGTGWLQRAYLKASNAGQYDNFGRAVAISEDTIVVGASGEASNFSGVENTSVRTPAQDDNSAAGSGAAYVFVRNNAGTVWTQQAYLKASNTGISDRLGHAVAVSGHVVVIGAYNESSSATGVNPPSGQDNNAAYASGAAYVFVRSGAVWSQQAYVKASNPGTGLHPTDGGDYFGLAVGISGETMVAGAPREDSDATGINGNQSNNASQNSGAAYIFTGFAPPNGSEIAVEHPAGVNLIDGSAFLELGVVPVGSSRDLVFIIRNNGNDELTGLSITFDGEHAADFSVLVAPALSVASADSTSFTVRFAPGAVGIRSARLHLASNDGDENPFDITLTSTPSAPEYLIDTIAGTGEWGFSGDNGLATEARLKIPWGVAVDSAGSVYVADYSNHRVRRVGTDGIITTFAGNGIEGFNGDGGPATQAQLSSPSGVAVDAAGNVYITDFEYFRVRRVDTNGIITTFAGTGMSGFSGDGGPATQAQVGRLIGLFVDSTGNVYMSDTFYHVVRRVDSNGIITTVAGTGVGGFSGDRGLATLAQLNFPTGLAVDSIGNLFIADQENHRVRRVGTNGIINTIAGNGLSGFRGDGWLARAAQLRDLGGLVESAGNVFVAANHRIRRVDASGIIATVAGDGRPEGTDGPNAISSPVGIVYGMAKDGAGNIFFTSEYRVRRLRPTGQTFPVKPIYASTPSAGTLHFPDLGLGEGAEDTFTEVTLFIGNSGTADLLIYSIDFTDTNASEVSISGLSGFPPRFIQPGFSSEDRHGIELTFRWTPSEPGSLETGVRVVSNDPVNPVVIYNLVGVAYDPAARVVENAFVGWVATILGGNPNDRSKSGGKTLALNGTQTAVLTIDLNSSPTLTAEIPAFLGGGSIQLSNFAGSVTVSLIPIPNDFERAFIRVEGGTMTAPSIQLPSGLHTGLNRLTFGSPEQSGGIIFLTNGSYTAYAAARIVNTLIPDGVAVRGNYSGIYNPETGEVSSQSESTDLFERSDRVLLSSSTNGFWLTWANTNGIEEATNILGPWRPVTNAASPYAVVTTNHPQQFFRLRQPEP